MTDLKFELDSTSFPMVWVESINAFMHWVPVTKIQFEYFLCAAPDSQFDSNWYDEILALNERNSPDRIKTNNYWTAFISGIKPSEAQRFARWSGGQFSLPTLEEWFNAYNTLKNTPPIPLTTIQNFNNLKDRTKKILERLDLAASMATQEVGYERTLADQMLMRMGVMEWVECKNQRLPWGGMGETHPSFHGMLFTPDHGQPSTPMNPEVDRLHHYGFRLIWRK